LQSGKKTFQLSQFPSSHLKLQHKDQNASNFSGKSENEAAAKKAQGYNITMDTSSSWKGSD
jgi:hypothetical protein